MINQIVGTNLSQPGISLLVNGFTDGATTILFSILANDTHYFDDPINAITLSETIGTFLDEGAADITRVDDSEVTVSIDVTAPLTPSNTTLTLSEGALVEFSVDRLNVSLPEGFTLSLSGEARSKEGGSAEIVLDILGTDTDNLVPAYGDLVAQSDTNSSDNTLRNCSPLASITRPEQENMTYHF